MSGKRALRQRSESGARCLVSGDIGRESGIEAERYRETLGTEGNM